MLETLCNASRALFVVVFKLEWAVMVVMAVRCGGDVVTRIRVVAIVGVRWSGDGVANH